MAIPYKDYVKFYNFIVVDGVGYYTTEEEKHRVNVWRESLDSSMYTVTMPDAIVVGDYVLKNRYGHNSF